MARGADGWNCRESVVPRSAMDSFAEYRGLRRNPVMDLALREVSSARYTCSGLRVARVSPANRSKINLTAGGLPLPVTEDVLTLVLGARHLELPRWYARLGR